MRNIYTIFIVTLILLTGCGDGGNGTPAVQPTIARLTLSTQGTLPAGKALSGINVTLQLPIGVTPTLTNGVVDDSVVKPSGVLAGTAISIIPTYYTPASDTALGTINFLVASNSVEGFATGEFATITLNIAPGAVNFASLNLSPSSPVTSTLKVLSASLHYLDGQSVNDISAVFTSVVL